MPTRHFLPSILPLVLLPFALAACADGPAAPGEPVQPRFHHNPDHGGGKGGGGDDGGGSSSDDVPLSIAFDDTQTGIRSDGGGAYVNGTDGVSAWIIRDADPGIHGMLQFWASDARKVRIYVDYGDGVFNGLAAPYTKTGSNPELAGGLHALAAVGDTLRTRLKVQWSDRDWSYTLRYGTECGGGVTPETAPNKVLITLTGTSPRTYAVAQGDDAILCRVPQKGRPARHRSAVRVPVAMTLVEGG